jgi:hypothetical protein
VIGVTVWSGLNDIGQKQVPATSFLSLQFPLNALIYIASVYCFLDGLFYEINKI